MTVIILMCRYIHPPVITTACCSEIGGWWWGCVRVCGGGGGGSGWMVQNWSNTQSNNPRNARLDKLWPLEWLQKCRRRRHQNKTFVEEKRTELISCVPAPSWCPKCFTMASRSAIHTHTHTHTDRRLLPLAGSQFSNLGFRGPSHMWTVEGGIANRR